MDNASVILLFLFSYEVAKDLCISSNLLSNGLLYLWLPTLQLNPREKYQKGTLSSAFFSRDAILVLTGVLPFSNY